MRRFITHYLVILLSSLLLASCQQAAPAPKPALDFSRYQPIYMDVGSIKVIEEYKSPEKLPYIEHLIPKSPADGVYLWVDQRLRTTPKSSKRLEVIIKDASVLATPLPKPEGMNGVFNLGQDKRYDARIEVEMRVYGNMAMSEASIAVMAKRFVVIGESASLAARDGTFRNMIADLMEAMNAELEKNMFLYLSNYISYSQSP